MGIGTFIIQLNTPAYVGQSRELNGIGIELKINSIMELMYIFQLYQGVIELLFSQ